MTFTLTINCDNAAFWADDSDKPEQDAYYEVARILHDAAKHIENGCAGRRLCDINGNHVGSFKFDEP
jgi:hypothetical protein